MKINKKLFDELKKYKNSLYDDFKVQFLYHSNKIEGSTFTEEALWELIDHRKIIGDHSVDDVQETLNSTYLFEYCLKDIYEPITKELLCRYHKILKKNTSEEELGLTGHYKTIMNRIRNSKVQVAYPNEVEQGIQELLDHWYSFETPCIEDVAYFHARFEHIHPFQDGNGRIGRFLIFKQCVENDIDLIAIDEEYSALYKVALENAQTSGDLTDLVKVFTWCQERIEKKMSIYQESILLLKEELETLEENEEIEQDGLSC